MRYGDPSSGYYGHRCLAVVMWSVGGWSVGGLRGEGGEGGYGQRTYGAGCWICSGSLRSPLRVVFGFNRAAAFTTEHVRMFSN